MTVDPVTVDALTRHTMALGFVAASLFSLLARRFGFSAFYLLALLETYWRQRYSFHGLMRDWLLGLSAHMPDKHTVQIILLSGFGVIAITGLIILIAKMRRSNSGLRLLILSTMGVCWLFSVEMISLHEVDQFIYTTDFGIIIRSGWMYALCAILAAIGVEWDRRLRFDLWYRRWLARQSAEEREERRRQEP